MTTQEAVYRVAEAEVESATQAIRTVQGEDRQIWNLKLLVPSISKFASAHVNMPLQIQQTVGT